MSGDYDIFHMDDLYQKMSDILGNDEDLSLLNELFRQCFFKYSMIDLFIQGFTNDLVYSLITRDMDSNRQVFQLMLDDRME